MGLFPVLLNPGSDLPVILTVVLSACRLFLVTEERIVEWGDTAGTGGSVHRTVECRVVRDVRVNSLWGFGVYSSYIFWIPIVIDVCGAALKILAPLLLGPDDLGDHDPGIIGKLHVTAPWNCVSRVNDPSGWGGPDVWLASLVTLARYFLGDMPVLKLATLCLDDSCGHELLLVAAPHQCKFLLAAPLNCSHSCYCYIYYSFI